MEPGGLDLGRVLTQALQLEHMKRQRAAAPWHAGQELMQILQHDPRAQLSPSLQQSLSGMAGGVPFEEIQGGLAPVVQQARANELRKELRKMRQAYKSQAASNEMILSTLLPPNMDEATKRVTMQKMRAMQAARAQEDLRDMLNEYPDMVNSPLGQQLLKEFVDSFRIESGGLDLSAIWNAPPTQMPKK